LDPHIDKTCLLEGCTFSGHDFFSVGNPGLHNRYYLFKDMSSGGEGDVFFVRCLHSHEPFAIKMPLHRAAPADLKRLRHELSVLSDLRNPHVVRVFDDEEALQDPPYLRLEYVPGHTLHQLIHDSLTRDRVDVNSIVRQCFRGLRDIHRGIRFGTRTVSVLHRDIAPKNILVSEDGLVKYIDFGFSRRLRSTSRTIVLGGTPGYMAPEVLKTGQSTVQSDLYSVGACLYDLLSDTNEVGADRKAFAPDLIPEKYRRILLACVQEDPSNRPRSAEEVIALLT